MGFGHHQTRNPNSQFLEKSTTIRENLGQEYTYEWMRGSNSPCMPQVHRRSTGSSPDFRPARGRFWPSHAWGGSPAARWASPGARGRWLTPACVVVTRRRGRTGRQEEEAAAEEEWRKRESVVRGGHRGNGERSKGHAKLPVCPSLLPFIYSTVQT